MYTEIHFDKIKYHILTELRKAGNSVCIAVAWFTDDDLFQELVKLSKKGILLQLVLNKDEINDNSGLDYGILFRNGGMLYFVNSDKNLMHNKFCVIDNKVVLNGSFNWTRKASSNFENLTITRDVEASNKFLEQFELLKRGSVPYFEKISECDLEYLNNSNDDLLNFEQLIERAFKRKENGNYLASLLDLKRVIKINPNKKVDLLFDLAYCQSELGDIENAIKNYSKNIELNPKCASSYNNRGLLYQEKMELRFAYEDFSKAIENQLNEYIYYYNRAELSKSYLPHYKLTFNISDPKEISKMAEFNFGKGYWDRPNLEKIILQGVEDYLNVVRLNKRCDKGSIYGEVGEIYYELRDHNKSIEYYTKAIILKPDYHYGYYGRGWSNYALNRFDSAISDIEKALKINPNNEAYVEAIKRIRKERLKPKNWFK